MPTEERLLGAAAREFARVGYARARLEDVAARAGIRRPSLLYHYKTKRALYEAAVKRVFGDLETALGAAMAASRSAEDLAVRFSEHLERRPELAALLMRQFIEGDAFGRRLFAGALLPLVDALESYLGTRRKGRLPARAAVLTVASTLLLRAGAGEMKDLFWGGSDPTRALARHLLTEEAV